MTGYNVNMDIKPKVQAFFDEATNTISYIVKDPSSNACAILAQVLDRDVRQATVFVGCHACQCGLWWRSPHSWQRPRRPSLSSAT